MSSDIVEMAEDTKDFYGYDDSDYSSATNSLPISSSQSMAFPQCEVSRQVPYTEAVGLLNIARPLSDPVSSTNTNKKMGNQQKLNELRAQLIANRAARTHTNADSLSTVQEPDHTEVEILSRLGPLGKIPMAVTNIQRKSTSNDSSPPKMPAIDPLQRSATSSLSSGALVARNVSRTIGDLLVEGQAAAMAPSTAQCTQDASNASDEHSIISTSAAALTGDIRANKSTKFVGSKQSKPNKKQVPNGAIGTTIPLNSRDQITIGKRPTTLLSEESPNQISLSRPSSTLVRAVTAQVGVNHGPGSTTYGVLESSMSDTKLPTNNAITNSATPLKDRISEVSGGLRHIDAKDDEHRPDLELWLQISGYHDRAFREQMIKTHKLRTQLEGRKRKLEEEYVEIERQEAAIVEATNSTPYMRTPSMLAMRPSVQALPPGTENNSVTEAGTAMSGKGLISSIVAGVKRSLSPSGTHHMDQPSRKTNRLEDPEDPVSTSQLPSSDTKPPAHDQR